ncbi:putative ribonuclease h protein [Quercus suber]|uniref:Ribonuclease h protein n=1 Tax=Quercus suber TaxID=58331 RepID=A0AAW0LWF6_QUESU
MRGRRAVNFEELLEKVNNKLQGWKTKLLSQAGRVTLIISILQSLPDYSFSCIKVPDKICTKLDSITNAFCWGHQPSTRKLHLINWNTICRPRNEGGLGIRKFKLMNQASIAKQFWRIIQQPQSILAKTLISKYCHREQIFTHKPIPSSSWSCKNIMHKPNPKLFQCTWKVSTGQNIPLQHPAWFKPKNPSTLEPTNCVANLIKLPPTLGIYHSSHLYTIKKKLGPSFTSQYPNQNHLNSKQNYLALFHQWQIPSEKNLFHPPQ